jgi:hypothetical protein
LRNRVAAAALLLFQEPSRVKEGKVKLFGEIYHNYKLKRD